MLRRSTARRLAAAAAVVVLTPLLLAGAAHASTAGAAHATTAGTAVAPAASIGASAVVAVEGRNSQLYVSSNGAAFTSLGGTLRGAPSVVSYRGQSYFFVRGSDDDIYVRTSATAYTRPHPGLDCATAPGASGDGEGHYLVGCVGTNGQLYSVSGVLSSTASAGTLTHYSQTGLNTDSTAVRGGVGSFSTGLFLSATGRAHAGGNVYQFTPSAPTRAALPSGSCAGPPADVSGSDGVFLVCRAESGAATVAYLSSTSTRTINLGGQALPGVAAVENSAGDGIIVIVTGSNDELYSATVSNSGTARGFTHFAVPGTSAAGPAATAD